MPLRRARPDLRGAWVDYHPGLPGPISLPEKELTPISLLVSMESTAGRRWALVLPYNRGRRVRIAWLLRPFAFRGACRSHVRFRQPALFTPIDSIDFSTRNRGIYGMYGGGVESMVQIDPCIDEAELRSLGLVSGAGKLRSL